MFMYADRCIHDNSNVAITALKPRYALDTIIYIFKSVLVSGMIRYSESGQYDFANILSENLPFLPNRFMTVKIKIEKKEDTQLKCLRFHYKLGSIRYYTTLRI